MIEIEITKEMKKRAWKKAREMGVIHNSIMKGGGNIAGFLGEEIANSLIEGAINNTYDYDITSKSGIKYDVKTKRCTSAPKPNYECSVANYNTKQQCDRYVFVRIKNNKFDIKTSIKSGQYEAWYLGWLDKKEYFDKAVFHKKGEVDSNNGFTFKADCYNIPISLLN